MIRLMINTIFFVISYFYVIDLFNKDRQYKYITLPPTQLLIGYDCKPIIIDMLKTPHLLLTGLSNQGKSKCLKVILKNLRDCDIVLCNAFEDDYRGIRGLRLKGDTNILNYINKLLEGIYRRDRPLYIVLEELATIKDKKLLSAIQELLCVARHYNIYVIGVIQIATKEELRFKSYFNARCTFRQLDDSAYRVVLCTTVEEQLKQREFYLLSDDLYKGRTYSIN